MRFAGALVVMALAGCNQIIGNGNFTGPPNDANDGSSLPPDACAGMQCQVANCASQGLPPTSVSGTVYAPNGTLPLYGIAVYAPNIDPGPLSPTLACHRCGDPLPGNPIVTTTSDEAGHFSLANVPAGANVALVITNGKWRRILNIPQVDPCADHALSIGDTTLPKSRTDLSPNTKSVDLPQIAVTTGNADALECLVRKIGIADSEITSDGQGGRVHLYNGNGAATFAAGFPGGGGALPSATTLWTNPTKLATYDTVILSCEGAQNPNTKPQAALDAMKAYADSGGRVFASHWHNIWIEGSTQGGGAQQPAVWPAIATWNNSSVTPDGGVDDMVDELNNPKGPAFATWLLNVAGSTIRDHIGISPGTFRNTVAAVDNTKAARWVYWSSAGVDYPQNFVFTTPNEAAQTMRCGKFAFSDMHVSGDSTSTPGVAFPGSCSTQPMTPQEKALAFMWFDLQGCVGP